MSELKDFSVMALNRAPQGLVLVNGPNPDKICVAEGCSDAGTTETLAGLLFCIDHWSQWYSPDTPSLKPDAIIGVPAEEYFKHIGDIGR
jgi:hypothetical protein